MQYFSSNANILPRSWSQVAAALTDDTGRRQTSSEIVKFLADEYVHGLVKDPSVAFAPPSDSTKKDFETKTAPINVTSASADRHDIKSLKEDAEWLSKSAKLNLVSALRIAALEVISSPAQHLRSPLSSQDATNLQEAAGLQDGQSTSFVTELGAGAALDADEISAKFEAKDAKRTRLFNIFLTERRYFMLAMDNLQSLRLYNRLPTLALGDSDKLAALYSMKPSSHRKDESVSHLSSYLKIVTNSMSSLEAGLKSVSDESILLQEDIELNWLNTLLTETTHALSVVFQLADSLGGDFPPSSAINQWFALMEAYNFFDTINPVSTSPRSLRLSTIRANHVIITDEPSDRGASAATENTLSRRIAMPSETRAVASVSSREGGRAFAFR